MHISKKIKKMQKKVLTNEKGGGIIKEPNETAHPTVLNNKGEMRK